VHAVRVLDDFDPVLARARAGSAEAYTALYGDLVRPVAAFLRARGVQEVEDVTSDVFLAVFTGIRGFTGNQQQFRSQRVAADVRDGGVDGQQIAAEARAKAEAQVHRAAAGVSQLPPVAKVGRVLTGPTADATDVAKAAGSVVGRP
jgi:hypothetical protein